MIKDNEAYIPPTCPALAFEVEQRPLQGYVAKPEVFSVLISELDASRLHTFGEFVLEGLGIGETGARAGAIDETCSDSDFEKSKELARLNTELNIEKRLGEKYCERIKACTGVIVRDGVRVCGALDPRAFPEVMAEIPIPKDEPGV